MEAGRLGPIDSQRVLKAALLFFPYVEQATKVVAGLVKTTNLSHLTPEKLTEICQRTASLVTQLNLEIQRSGLKGNPYDIALRLFETNKLSGAAWQTAKLLYAKNLPEEERKAAIKTLGNRFNLPLVVQPETPPPTPPPPSTGPTSTNSGLGSFSLLTNCGKVCK